MDSSHDSGAGTENSGDGDFNNSGESSTELRVSTPSTVSVVNEEEFGMLSESCLSPMHEP